MAFDHGLVSLERGGFRMRTRRALPGLELRAKTPGEIVSESEKALASQSSLRSRVRFSKGRTTRRVLPASASAAETRRARIALHVAAVRLTRMTAAVAAAPQTTARDRAGGSDAV